VRRGIIAVFAMWKEAKTLKAYEEYFCTRETVSVH